MYLREGEEEYHLVENDCILLDPTRKHVGYRTSVCNFLYVHFSQDIREVSAVGKGCMSEGDYTDTEGKEQGRAETGRQDKDIRIPKYYHMDEMLKTLRCREMARNMTQLFRGHEPYDQIQAECLFQELLLIEAADYANSMHRKTVPVHGKVREVIPQLITYLNTSYQEEISGEMLAEKYHYHFDYLNRQFTKWTDKTIFHYLNTVRVERARQLLMTGFYSMEEIAAQTGFRDVYYFSRVFKKYWMPGKTAAARQAGCAVCSYFIQPRGIADHCFRPARSAGQWICCRCAARRSGCGPSRRCPAGRRRTHSARAPRRQSPARTGSSLRRSRGR